MEEKEKEVRHLGTVAHKLFFPCIFSAVVSAVLATVFQLSETSAKQHQAPSLWAFVLACIFWGIAIIASIGVIIACIYRSKLTKAKKDCDKFKDSINDWTVY